MILIGIPNIKCESAIEWSIENCRHPWTQDWKDPTVFIFDNDDDALMFKLALC